jgi:hypothetical protein
LKGIVIKEYLFMIMEGFRGKVLFERDCHKGIYVYDYGEP